MRGGDERADAAPRLQDARALEVGVDARDRVRVHLQLDGQLPDGRQLRARRQPPRRNRPANALFELGVERRRVPVVDGEQPAHACRLLHGQ